MTNYLIVLIDPLHLTQPRFVKWNYSLVNFTACIVLPVIDVGQFLMQQVVFSINFTRAIYRICKVFACKHPFPVK